MKVDDNKGNPIIELEEGDGSIIISPTGNLEIAFNAEYTEDEKVRLNKVQQSLFGVCLGLSSSPKFIKIIQHLTNKHYDKMEGKQSSGSDPMDDFELEEIKETNFDDLYNLNKMKVETNKPQ